MPIYEYECESCSLTFEVRRGFGENEEASCPRCSGEARRVFSPVPIFFKGSGFYVTDGGGRRNSAGRPRREDEERSSDEEA